MKIIFVLIPLLFSLNVWTDNHRYYTDREPITLVCKTQSFTECSSQNNCRNWTSNEIQALADVPMVLRETIKDFQLEWEIDGGFAPLLLIKNNEIKKEVEITPEFISKMDTEGMIFWAHHIGKILKHSLNLLTRQYVLKLYDPRTADTIFIDISICNEQRSILD